MKDRKKNVSQIKMEFVEKHFAIFLNKLHMIWYDNLKPGFSLFFRISI